MTEDDAAKLMSELLDKMMAEAIGFPRTPNRMTCLCYVNGRFESREIGDDGKIIEPPQRCCNGTVLHEPNCKSWGAFS